MKKKQKNPEERRQMRSDRQTDIFLFNI